MHEPLDPSAVSVLLGLLALLPLVPLAMTLYEKRWGPIVIATHQLSAALAVAHRRPVMGGIDLGRVHSALEQYRVAVLVLGRRGGQFSWLPSALEPHLDPDIYSRNTADLPRIAGRIGDILVRRKRKALDVWLRELRDARRRELTAELEAARDDRFRQVRDAWSGVTGLAHSLSSVWRLNGASELVDELAAGPLPNGLAVRHFVDELVTATVRISDRDFSRRLEAPVSRCLAKLGPSATTALLEEFVYQGSESAFSPRVVESLPGLPEEARTHWCTILSERVLKAGHVGPATLDALNTWRILDPDRCSEVMATVFDRSSLGEMKTAMIVWSWYRSRPVEEVAGSLHALGVVQRLLDQAPDYLALQEEYLTRLVLCMEEKFDLGKIKESDVSRAG